MSLKLSVVFFTYNRSGYLAHAISEFINNNQLDRNEYEIIISDDGSDELHRKKITQIKEDFAVEKVLLNKHKGASGNFNSGLRAAEGKYVLHMEDDWALQNDAGNMIKRSLAFLDQHPEVSIVRLSPLRGIDPLTGLKPYSDGFQKLENSKNSYSNGPHLKRKDFHKYLNWYKEEISAKESESLFQDLIFKLNIKVCWSGNIFSHFGSISSDGIRFENTSDQHELVYNSSSSREELLDIAKLAMKDNKVFLARHVLETFKATGECDPQVEQSLEIVSEICKQY